LSRIDAKFELDDIKAVFDVNYNLNGASFVFPHQGGSNSDGITPRTKRKFCIYLIFLILSTLDPINQYNSITEVTITTNPLPDIASTFEATAHLIPQIAVGISALGGIASTSVFLNLNASADFNASTTSVANSQTCVTASTDINVGVGAQESFFNLFDVSVVKSLFDKKFPLFQVRPPGLPHMISML
jgi:hypothetical protein